MPGYRCHTLAGILAVIAAALISSSLSYVLIIERTFFCLAGALFPDLDTHSKGRRLFLKFMPLAILIAFACYKLQVIIIVCAYALFMYCVPHRGIFHRLWFIALSGFLASYCYAECSTSAYLLVNASYFLAGGFTHVVLDYGLRRRFT